MTPALLVVGVLAVTGGLLLLVLAVVPAGTRQVPLSRLDPATAPRGSALAGAGVAAGAAVERVLARRGRLASGTAALERAGSSLSLPDFVVRTALAGMGLGLLGGLAGGPLAGLLLAAAAPLGAKALLSWRTGRRRAAFADQLDDSLQLMASSLRAGHSLLRAIDSVSQEASAPTSEEFARIVNETRVGRDLSDALDEVGARMGSDDFTWVAQAIAIHREVGGNLAEVLDVVGRTIRERNAIRRQVKALAAEGKLSAVVLMSLPFGVSGFIALTNPGYVSAFTETPTGLLMLGVCVLLLVVGAFWLKKMVRIRF
ncbi:tight adherence protein B [Geodermatophilus bullaregiensis]|uniref:type II secretion system F family protein n=1 Tax=Geodermatophilus bullaregiensis TaxID=1564160 RepID=UPI00195C5278|nr:type II secretion system F family protein [Geodermatophilus bullaregiensis]MBM7804934.1 tight adherence protein B [Geodermatophilus bullaregiensis]